MSATLEVERVARFLGDCPTVRVPGAPHPLTVEYASGESIRDAVAGLLPRTGGQLLCFLPGAREIDRARSDLSLLASSSGIDVVPLHGSLDAERQDDAIRATATRRVILATNIAETSLTVPGVSVVIDTGQVKVARYDPQRGVDSLTLERVTQDSADQRAGRAARRGPGIARRLWESRDRLRAHREPEIARVDLAAPLLDLLAWGGDPASFDWFDPPPPDRVDAALRLLERLGAIERGACHTARDTARAPAAADSAASEACPDPARRPWRARDRRCVRAAGRTTVPRTERQRLDDLRPAAGARSLRPSAVPREAGGAGAATNRGRRARRRCRGARAGGGTAPRALHRVCRPPRETARRDDRSPHAGDRSRRRARPRIGRAGRRLSRGARRRRLDTGWHRRVTDSGREPCRARVDFADVHRGRASPGSRRAGACVRGVSPAMASSFSAKRP